MVDSLMVVLIGNMSEWVKFKCKTFLQQNIMPKPFSTPALVQDIGYCNSNLYIYLQLLPHRQLSCG